MDGMDPQGEYSVNRLLRDESGQSVVEYILLLAVVSSLAGVLFKTDFWQSYFGPDGKFDSIFRAKIEYSYRHSLGGNKFYGEAPPNYGSKNHDSYYSGQSTRFYRPNEAYPKN